MTSAVTDSIVHGTTDDNPCEECGGRLRYDDHEIYCEDCGYVVDESALDRVVWRSLDAITGGEDDKLHAKPGGYDPRLHDGDLGSWMFQGDAIREGVPRRQRLMLKAASYDKARSRELDYGLGRVTQLAGHFDLSKTMLRRCLQVWREVYCAREAWTGYNLDHLAEVSVLIGARDSGYPLLFDDLVEASDADVRLLRRVYLTACAESGIHPAPIDPRDLIPRFGEALEVSIDRQNKAMELLDRADEEGALGTGASPVTLAATALYWVCSGGLTQVEVAEVVGISRVVMRARLTDFDDVGVIDRNRPGVLL